MIQAALGSPASARAFKIKGRVSQDWNLKPELTQAEFWILIGFNADPEQGFDIKFLLHFFFLCFQKWKPQYFKKVIGFKAYRYLGRKGVFEVVGPEY